MQAFCLFAVRHNAAARHGRTLRAVTAVFAAAGLATRAAISDLAQPQQAWHRHDQLQVHPASTPLPRTRLASRPGEPGLLPPASQRGHRQPTQVAACASGVAPQDASGRIHAGPGTGTTDVLAPMAAPRRRRPVEGEHYSHFRYPLG
jgi:hypothetical protein